MKKFWRLIGGIYMFFKKNSKGTPLFFVLVILVQFILLITLLVQLNLLKSEFIEYRENSTNRINQIYGQVYSISSRLNR